MNEPLVVYAHPLYRIDTPPDCAAFLGLDPGDLGEDWRGRALRAEAEVVILQGVIDGLAGRVAAQSELLSARAERDSAA